ncbi:hypothetical protein ACUTR7_00450 [Delftia sp. NA_296.1]|uniref:hypothetical protein n=1 Tax=Delftia sp. NA_296.1 TaxID=3415648 RepID=UPI00404649D2
MSEQTRRYGENPPAPPISQRPEMPPRKPSLADQQVVRSAEQMADDRRVLQAYLHETHGMGLPKIVPLGPQGPSPDMMALINALAEQTAAINHFARSNEALVQAMAQDGEMGDDLPPTVGLNGKPL